MLMAGNPRPGQTHPAIGVGLAAHRQNHRVCFYIIPQPVNELHQTRKATNCCDFWYSDAIDRGLG